MFGEVQTLRIVLVIPSWPDELFALREFIILFMSVSVVGMALIPGNFLRNASFKNEMA
jgi:hypothetical protein